jgi:hypothetical protein
MAKDLNISATLARDMLIKLEKMGIVGKAGIGKSMSFNFRLLIIVEGRRVLKKPDICVLAIGTCNNILYLPLYQ